LKNRKNLNKLKEELNPMNNKQLMGYLMLIIAFYLLLFSIMPEATFYKIFPYLSSVGRRPTYFILSYIFFVVGIYIYIGKEKIKRIFK